MPASCARSSRPPPFASGWSAPSRGSALDGGPAMARSELALAAVRRAYDRAHAWTAARGVALAAVFGLLAIGLHRTTHATWIVGSVLAIALAGFGWRGGAARRGALAGA